MIVVVMTVDRESGQVDVTLLAHGQAGPLTTAASKSLVHVM